MAVIDVERVGFSHFDHVAVYYFDARRVTAVNHVAPIDLPYRYSAAAAQDRNLAIIRDVKVEVTVAVDVGQSERMATGLEDEPGRFGDVFEPAITAIEEAGVWTAQRTNDQVELAVSVDIGKNGAARSLVCAGNASPCGDILEPAISKITVERVGAL